MNQISLAKFFGEILRSRKLWLLLIIQAPILGAFYVPANNYAVKLIVNHLTSGEVFDFHKISFAVFLFCASGIVLELVWRIANYADYRSQPEVEAEIIDKSYEMLLSHEYKFFQNNLSGKIASKISALRDSYIGIFDSFVRQTVYFATGILIVLAMLFAVNLQLALGVFLWLVIFMPAIFWTKKRSLKFSALSTAQKQKISGLINDGISNINNVLLFNARNQEKNFVYVANQEFIKCEKTRLKFMFINHFVIGFIYCSLSIAVMFFLIYLKSQNLISNGDFIMVLGLLYFLIEITWQLLGNVDSLLKDFGNLCESFKILQENQQIFDCPDAHELTISSPKIEFKNLSFSYSRNSDENRVFDNFNLSIQGGETIGLVGHSGAGKSTLVNLLLKVFLPNSGEILIDGQNIAKSTLESLRSQIAVIPQDPALFHRSIYENIAYGKNQASESEVIEASKKAHIHDFIMTLPEGYRTLVGERGVKISGGQKQRIAIARAILKNAPILILDEATSSLDYESENQIQASIKEILSMKKITVIAIAHRLSTIKNMDRIVMIDKGKIVEDGNFSQLTAKENGEFKKLWNQQFQVSII